MLYCIVVILSVGICIVSFITLFHSDRWYIRVFEFPRFQNWLLTLIFIAILVTLQINSSREGFWVIFVLLLLNLAYLTYQIYPYTVFSEKQVLRNPDRSLPSLKAMVSNVYQFNRQAERLIEMVKDHQPDVLLLVETDQWWTENVMHANFAEVYPHHVLIPQEETYGMLFFSKFPLKDVQKCYLVQDHIPSITTYIDHPDNGLIKIYAVHPEPPLPSLTLSAKERDAELLIVAEAARKETYPVIVMGDLNDVAWSRTTELFLKTSKLLDPRRGRGMYSTFHAKYPIFRWPLDHFFFSAHFLLNELKVLPAIGSDHFPILVDISINLDENQEHKKMDAEEEDYEKAEEKMEEVEKDGGMQ